MVKRLRTDDAEQPCPPRLCRRGSAGSTACAAVQRIRGLHRRGEPPAAFVASEVLDRAEVAEQLKWASEVGWQFGWGRGDQSANRRRDYRSAFTVEVDDAALAMQLFERIRHAVPAQLTVRTAEQAGGDVSAMGEWHVSGLSARLLYVQYRGGGHFSPHVDGFLIEGMHRRSLYTCLVYLSDVPGTHSGAETNLLLPPPVEARPSDLLVRDACGRYRGSADMQIAHSQKPVSGTALCFYQSVLHEGAPTRREEEGETGPAGWPKTKYLLRADVMYERKHKRPLLAVDQAAFGLLQRAEAAESARIGSESCPSLHAAEADTARQLRLRAFACSGRVRAMFGTDQAVAEAAVMWRTR